MTLGVSHLSHMMTNNKSLSVGCQSPEWGRGSLCLGDLKENKWDNVYEIMTFKNIPAERWFKYLTEYRILYYSKNSSM